MSGARRLRSVPGSCLLPPHRLLALLVLLGPGCALFNHNLRAVEPGAFYRSGQMPANTLARTLRRHDIGTVISLRGPAPNEKWFQEEQTACAAQDVAHYSMGWSKSRLPEPDSLREFVRLCRESEGPVLVHCQGGVHRSGVASAVYVLLSGGSLDEARDQFGLFFNNAPIGHVLDLYEGSETPFGEWVVQDYPRLKAAAP